MVVLYIFSSVILVSLISLLGAVFLIVGRNFFQNLIFISLALSSGVLLATAFLDLYPEALQTLPWESPYLLLLGIIVFFLIEKLVHWHHCVDGEDCPEKPLAYMSLIGDAVHNFADGIVIAAAYLANPALGLATTLAVVAHEIPHELSDFSLLIYGGFKSSKALFFNFLSALTAVFGAVVVLLFADGSNRFVPYLIPFAAGNFIYIAASDLFPELRKSRGLKSTLFQVFLIILGVAIIVVIKE